ncbi:TetR/AcrR family transcriptional regulator [Actinoplanes sp. NPDC049599]|uniref:TetR/AcrR family transcriptional regulator n=1 Tax=Actinoplanes sp. NPDC049599 TaxID=3363903 RepID=UPI0037AF9389
MVTTSPERFAALTDAAIALIAELGMRGLTHRAVDARAGLPAGTASAYLRTRKALVEAVVRRLADLDTADLAARGVPTGPVGAPPDLEQLSVGFAGLLDDWLTAGRARTLARYACLLEATHHPELRPILAYGVAMRTQARVLLAAAGAPDAERRGSHLVAAVDGLLFDRLAGAGSLAAPPPGTPESRADLTAAIRGLLRAALAD